MTTAQAPPAVAGGLFEIAESRSANLQVRTLTVHSCGMPERGLIAKGGMNHG